PRRSYMEQYSNRTRHTDADWFRHDNHPNIYGVTIQTTPPRHRLAWYATLRSKTLLVVVSILVALLMVLYIPLQSIVLESFRTLEEESMQTDVERVHQSLAFKLNQVDMATQAWAIWDDTYTFIE